MNIVKQLFQRIFAPLLSNSRNFTEGVSVLLCCKNEAHNIGLCLDSLLPFAQQIICIDNGSNDASLEKMNNFKSDHPEVDITILELADVPLCEARNAGLAHVKHRWLLHIGADFVFYKEGPTAFTSILAEMSRINTYCSWRFPFINLYGDLRHTYKHYATRTLGEHYFFRMSKHLKFVEKGKFDFLRTPFYYTSHTYNEVVFFHLDGLKSDDRLLYRNAYFEWRQTLNAAAMEEKEALSDFERFFTQWKKQLFGTTEKKRLKFRFQRQLAALHFAPYRPEQFAPYPKSIEALVANTNTQFEVIYKNDKPYRRSDHNDTEMLSYQPDESDLNWDINAFQKKYEAKKYLSTIKKELIQQHESTIKL
jgi:glycosyltransferase involved in cell wall biosynthesis